jgi:hypothetical protein
MMSRLLDRDEWHRLSPDSLPVESRALMPPETVALVVERDGAIIASWIAMPVWHLEGVWIEPAHRKNVAVARRLLTGMRGVLRALGLQRVITHALDDDVRALLVGHLNAIAIPGTAYSIRLE